MTTDGKITALGNKLFDIASFTKLSRVDQFVLETKCTDYLQTLLDYINANYLKNFQLNLVMEEKDTNV